MLAYHRDLGWSAQCGACLVSPLSDVTDRIKIGTQDAAVTALRDAGWEVEDHSMRTWCPPCSSKRQAPAFPLTSRGMPRKRR